MRLARPSRLASSPGHRPSSRGLLLPRVVPAPVTATAAFALVLGVLLLADHWCYLAARLPIRVVVSPHGANIVVDGQTLTATWPETTTAVRLVSSSATRREYQIDGTDSTNNFTEDDSTLALLATSPYYQFQAWMRDNPTFSAWTNIHAVDARTKQTVEVVDAVPSGHVAELPVAGSSVITASLERPEAPVSIAFLAGQQTIATLTINRNDRVLDLSVASTGQDHRAAFFPERPGPFAAEVVDSLVRTGIWALLLLGAAVALTCGAAALFAFRPFVLRAWRRVQVDRGVPAVGKRVPRARAAPRARWLARFARFITPPGLAATAAVTGSFVFVTYIALVQYRAMPHILDASAYFFQAKIFASGRFSVPALASATFISFDGPFMVAWHGRWFALYPPATSAVLALGMRLGVPWLVEPLLGTASLVGIFLLGRRMFGPWTAALAVALVALSPFYSYLAASYLSHPVALCAEVYFLLFLLRFLDTHRTRDLVAAAGALALMFATREFETALIGGVAAIWVLGTHGRSLWRDRERTLPAVLFAVVTLWTGLLLSLTYNGIQTGNPLLLPRTIFAPAEHYGFGTGVGFYGRHTPAAGLVNLDEQLTALFIDLFGWPFYLTLALVPLALVRRDASSRWDWFNLAFVTVVVAAQVGYFYHGIFLGPRYLYETLPFLALLTGRGAIALAVISRRGACVLFPRLGGATSAGAATAVVATLMGGLVLCNLLFYLPRQLAQHRDFTGLPATERVDVAALYALPIHHALVITTDAELYDYVLWPLNDPDLKGDVIYAVARSPADESALCAGFGGRTLYDLVLDERGHVSLVPACPTSRLPSPRAQVAGPDGRVGTRLTASVVTAKLRAQEAAASS